MEHYDNIPTFSFSGKFFETKILDVYDGDTITILINLDKSYKISCRLLGLDTPELRSNDENEKKAGYLARDYLLFLITHQKTSNLSRKEIRNLLAENTKKFKVECFDFDKYGRTLIKINFGGITLNDKMIEDGFAGIYDGNKKQHFLNYFKHLS